MKQLTTKAIVLKRTNFQEADRIVTLISEDHGKIRVIAKGVRKMKSKLAGGLELLSVSDITYIVGRSEIYTLISSRLDRHYKNIVSDIDRTMQAYDMIKHIDKIVEDHSGQDFYIILQQGLSSLDNLSIDYQLTQLWFNLQLLKVYGHAPNLATQSSGQPLVEDEQYDFDVDDMAFRSSKSGGYAANQIKLLRLAIDSKTPTTLSKVANSALYAQSALKLSELLVRHQYKG